MSNPGKVFEQNFSSSGKKQGLLFVRFNDSDMSFHENKEFRSRFTAKNPADYVAYKYPDIFFLELKSTKYKSIGFERDENDKAMIQLHQIRDLSNLKLYEGVQAGFVFNFRVEEDDEPYKEYTYYMDIEDFVNFYNSTDKKSINKVDIVQNGGFVVEAKQRRKFYDYDVNKMFSDIILHNNAKNNKTKLNYNNVENNNIEF